MGTTAIGRPAQSLADYARSLSAGSRCFCCGAELRASRPRSGGPSQASDRAVVLSCPVCGCEVGPQTAGEVLEEAAQSEEDDLRRVVSVIFDRSAA